MAAWACCAASSVAVAVRPVATAAGPLPPQRGSSAHLLRCSDPHQTEAAPDDLRDSHRQFQPRARKLWIILQQEAARRIVIAAVPQSVEFGRQVIEIESDAVRLVSQRRRL